jgi:hypothetical protein
LVQANNRVLNFTSTVFFDDAEWKAFVGFMHQTPIAPTNPPTLKQAIIMVASLGGFLNRKSDKQPGTETIWRGIFGKGGETALFTSSSNLGHRRLILSTEVDNGGTGKSRNQCLSVGRKRPLERGPQA